MRFKLVEIIKLLSSDCQDQIASFPDFVCIPDEMALLFDETYQLVGQISGLPQVTLSTLKKIDTILDNMSDDNENVWQTEALIKDSRWITIRNLAKNVLDDLGEPLKRPDISWVVYVPGEKDT